jgi:hypothetical protein
LPGLVERAPPHIADLIACHPEGWRSRWSWPVPVERFVRQ